MAKFNYAIHHVPGKLLLQFTAGTLSRAPDLPDEVETFIDSVTANLPASEQCLEAYRQAQLAHIACKQAVDYCRSGWLRSKKLFSLICFHTGVQEIPSPFTITSYCMTNVLLFLHLFSKGVAINGSLLLKASLVHMEHRCDSWMTQKRLF